MERPAKPGRMPFLDGLRAFAIVAMVVNHTARWWIDGSFGWPRYHLIYITTTVAAPHLPVPGRLLPGHRPLQRHRAERAERGERGAALSASAACRSSWPAIS